MEQVKVPDTLGAFGGQGIRGSGLDFALWIAELKVPDTFAERFKDQIEALLSRRARPAKAGRPKAKAESKAEIPV